MRDLNHPTMIEIRHLKLIQAVAEVGTLKNAADQLCLSQSALSHQLKEIESRLNTTLFYRISNQRVFTPAGKELLEASRDILERLRSAESNIQVIEQEQAKRYIHGYSQEESNRLNDQADSIADLLHWDSNWPAESRILEAGCGTGAQTKTIAQKNPECVFVSVDLSAISLDKARAMAAEYEVGNVTFRQADVMRLPYQDQHFDHIFVCFLLEHLPDPQVALLELKRVLKPRGTMQRLAVPMAEG